jgi:hypothetical protein
MGKTTPSPLEYQLQMISVTLTQWYKEENLEPPPMKRQDAAPSHVLKVDDVADSVDDAVASFSDFYLQGQDSSILLDAMHVDVETLDRTIEHVVFDVDCKQKSDTNYPKCLGCGLPGHSMEKCYPLINHCIAQTMAAQHPGIVKRIKVAYKQLPRTSCSRPCRPATVKQLVAELQLCAESPTPAVFDSIEHVATLDLSALNMYFGQAGTTLLCFHDEDTATTELPAHSFQPPDAEHSTFLLFQEPEAGCDTVSEVTETRLCLVDSALL